MNFDFLYLWGADLLALFHGLVVIPIFTIGPIWFYFSSKRIIWLERIFAIFAIITIGGFIITGDCFLSRLEWWLRAQADPSVSYDVGFVRFWLSKVGINWPDVWTFNLGATLIALGLGRVANKAYMTYKTDKLS